MNQIPNELYHIILSYYTNKCDQILLLRGISKSWKEIAEHSLLWLECPLQFSSPFHYILPSRRTQTLTLPLHSDYRSSLQNRSGTILIDRGNQTNLSLNPLDPSPNKHNQAYEIAQYFVRVYTFYHKNWWKYHRLASKLRVYYNNICLFLPTYMTCVKIIGTFLLALSSYFLMYLSMETIHSWKTILGFIFIFLYLLFYLIAIILYICKKTMSNYLYYKTQDNTNDFNFYINIEPIIEHIIIVLIIIELIIALLIIYFKLIHMNNSRNSRFLWSYTTIPLWVFPTIMIAMMMNELKKGGQHNQANVLITIFLGYFLYSIALSALLFAVHYDNPSILPSLGVALIPVFPLVLVEMVWIVKDSYKAMSETLYWIDRELLFRDPDISPCWWFLTRTFPNMFVTFSDSYHYGRRSLKRLWNVVFRVMAMFILLCLIVLVYIPHGLENVALTFNQSNLPSVTGLILMEAVILQCAWLPDMKDM